MPTNSGPQTNRTGAPTPSAACARAMPSSAATPEALSLALGRGWHRCALSSSSPRSSYRPVPGSLPVTTGSVPTSLDTSTATSACDAPRSTTSSGSVALNANSGQPAGSSMRPTWPGHRWERPASGSVTTPAAPRATSSPSTGGSAASSRITSAPAGSGRSAADQRTTGSRRGRLAAELAASEYGRCG